MSGCCSERLGVHHRREVVGELKVEVVLEDDESLRGERGVGGATETELRLTGLDGVLRLQRAVPERDHLGDVQPVRLLEPGLAERALGALGRRGQDDRLAERGEVRQRGEVVLGREVLGHEERVLVGRVGRVQHGEPAWLGQLDAAPRSCC